MGRYVTNIDTMDRELFEAAADNSPYATRLINDDSEAVRDLAVDAFGSFHKWEPRLRDDVGVDRRINRSIMKQIVDTQEFRQLRNYTVGDVAHSLGGLKAMSSILDQLPDRLKEEQKRAEEMARQVQEFAESNDLTSADVEQSLEELRQLARAQAQRVEDMTEAHGDEIRQAARQALREAAQEAADAESALVSLGYGTDEGDLSRVPTQSKLGIAKTLASNPKFRQIVDLAGRFIRMARKIQAEKVDYSRRQLSGVDHGADINRMLPIEALKLADDDLEMLWYRRYTERGLAQYKLDGKEPQGKGPIVCMIDCSGSMEGERDVWSKAVGLALYWIARKQKRDLHLGLFNTAVHCYVSLPARGPAEPERVIELLMWGVGGGTSYSAPLDYAMGLIEVSDPKADIVMVTDGECRTTPEWEALWQERKQSSQTSLYGIGVGLSGHFHTLERLADEVRTVEGDIMSNDGDALKMAFQI